MFADSMCNQFAHRQLRVLLSCLGRDNIETLDRILPTPNTTNWNNVMLRSAILNFFGCAVVALATHFSAIHSVAQVTFDLTRIADTNTASPNNDGQTFSSFGSPVVEGDRIVFTGSTNDSTNDRTNGIFAVLADGTLQTVIDENSLFFSPGTSFASPSFSGDEVAFFANTPGPLPSGLFVQDLSGSGLRTVATTSTPFPGATSGFDTFELFSAPSISDGVVAFGGTNFFNTSRTLFVDDGSGDLTTFDGVGSVSGVVVDGPDIYFLEGGSLFVAGADGTITSLIARGDSILPPSAQIGSLSVSDGNVAFDAGFSGIGTLIDGQLSLPITGSTAIPDTDDTFAILDDVALDGENFCLLYTSPSPRD